MQGNVIVRILMDFSGIFYFYKSGSSVARNYDVKERRKLAKHFKGAWEIIIVTPELGVTCAPHGHRAATWTMMTKGKHEIFETSLENGGPYRTEINDGLTRGLRNEKSNVDLRISECGLLSVW